MRFLLPILIFSFSHQSLPANKAADLCIINANVRTMTASPARAEAIAVSNGKIVAVGSRKSIARYIGPDTKTINAHGRLILPGFNDAHVHFAAIGNMFSSVDLRKAKTPQEIIERLSFYAKFLPKGRWILGSGWTNESLSRGDLRLSKQMIDAATPDHPVFLYHANGTAAIANSRALAIAGVNKTTKDPKLGSIGRDASGSLSGFLEGTAVALVRSIVPRSHPTNWAEIAETATNYAASLGVTSVQDVHSDDLADVYRELDRQGKLKTRVYDCTALSGWAKLAAGGIKAATGDAMVRTGCLKFHSDGDDESVEQLQRDIAAADKARLQLMIHAIGGRPNKIVLDVFEAVAKQNGTRDRRFRIEHAHGVRSDDLPRFATSNIIASMQPWLFNSSAAEVKRMFDAKARVAFGSDASLTDLNPLLAIHAAVNADDAISVEQAVKAYTVGSAYAEFQENVKGTIEPGKLADLVILSDDIFTIDRAKIRDAKVLKTILDGRVVYQASQ